MRENKREFVPEAVKMEWMRLNYILKSKKYTTERKQREKREYEEWIQHRKDIQSKSRSKNTIIRNIEQKQLNFSVLFTLKPEKQNTDVKVIKSSVTKLLRRYDIPYVLVPEFTEKGVIHFHGFIRVTDTDLYREKRYKGRPVYDRYKNLVYELLPLESNYGFTQLKLITEKSDIEKSRIINYVVKYITKTDSKIMSSRLPKVSKAYKLACEWFGSDIVEFVK